MTTIHDHIDFSDQTDAELAAELRHWGQRLARLNAQVCVASMVRHGDNLEHARAMRREAEAEITRRRRRTGATTAYRFTVNGTEHTYGMPEAAAAQRLTWLGYGHDVSLVFAVRLPR